MGSAPHRQRVLAGIRDNKSPDDTCSDIGLCDGSCRLFPKRTPSGDAGRPGPGRISDDRARGKVTRELADAAATAVALLRSVASDSVRAFLDAVGATSAPAPRQRSHNASIDPFYDAVADAARAASPCGLSLSCDIDRVFDKHLPFKDAGARAPVVLLSPYAPQGSRWGRATVGSDTPLTPGPVATDGDAFAGDGPLTKHFRGRDWRGTDCDDTNADVYPGRAAPPATVDPASDWNCNGVSGRDASGQLLEDRYCGGSKAKGLIALGDSALAHFHIPPQWMEPSHYGHGAFAGILGAVEDEMDWPQCSWSTAHAGADECPPRCVPISTASAASTGPLPLTPTSIPTLPPRSGGVPMKSIYQRMRERDRCVRNDFQNVGVNGARTSSMADHVMLAMRRNPRVDRPALAILALIGNDVCNGHPGMSHMTTPDAFRRHVLTILDHLNNTLPQGSTVLTIGLADGLLLYDTMHNLTHPLGVSYEDVYSYLICQSLTPCYGWMNPNATMRKLTQRRADALSAVYPEIAKSRSFANFDLIHYNIPWKQLMEQHEAAGGQARDLIEPVDGFHPSQLAQNMAAEQVWKWLEKEHPYVLPPVNPHNAEIDAALAGA